MGVEFDHNGRDANGFACCAACNYPYKGAACDNPGCVANPSVSEEQKARWRIEAEKRAAEDAERKRVAAMRRDPTGTIRQREAAQKHFASLSETARTEHKARWAEIENHVRGLAKKGAKVFEVAHAVEYARGLYFAEMLKGLPADLCYKTVMAAYVK
jgi:hypothetical protein